METANKFQELRKINVNDQVEKKNNLSYLSWAWAVDTLLQQDGTATWSYAEPVRFGETMMVFCSVNAFGKTMTAQLPVMNHRNQAIANPDAMAVNTAMQRCLAKAIALHGIGLYIYAGEDLPEQDVQAAPVASKPVTKAVWDTLDVDTQDYLRNIAMDSMVFINRGDAVSAVEYIKECALDADMQTGLWSLFDSKARSAMKAVSTTKKAA